MRIDGRELSTDVVCADAETQGEPVWTCRSAPILLICASKSRCESYALAMTCRIEVFVRSGHTIDLTLRDGEDRVFTNALHEAWATPEAIGFKHLALGENAVILATEVVGYRLHGSQETGSAQM